MTADGESPPDPARLAPFDTIEGAHEYLRLLGEVVGDVQDSIETETANAAAVEDGERRLEALRLVSYKLKRLQEHLTASRRILNDLRMLRRIL